MTDIVVRLRSLAQNICVDSAPAGTLPWQAAEEIERLRALISDCAKAALEPKP